MRHGRQRRRMLVRRRGLPDADACHAGRGLHVPAVFARGGGGRGALRMKHGNACRAAIAFAALAGFAPDALAAGVSILGKWQIIEAVPAPWVRPAGETAVAAAGRRQLNVDVTFAPRSVSSKFKPFDCKSKVLYESNTIQVDALFQGNLPEPNPAAAAARLGFPKGDIPSVDVRCLKALHTFHFRDTNTALIHLDRVIYTLKRQ
jgi:hypothetical protein